MTMTMIDLHPDYDELILAHDPGEKNFGYSVIHAQYNPHTLRMSHTILECGQLTNTMKGFNRPPQVQLADFITEQEKLIAKWGIPTIYIGERFYSRGLKGSQIESINMMLGYLMRHFSERYPKTSIQLTTSTRWKNACNLFFNLNQSYKVLRTPPHEWDATLIGMYAADMKRKIKPFTSMDNRGYRHMIADQVESISTSKLANRRLKRG